MTLPVTCAAFAIGGYTGREAPCKIGIARAAAGWIVWRDDEILASRDLRSVPAEFLLQFLIVSLDDPALFGQGEVYHFGPLLRIEPRLSKSRYTIDFAQRNR
jgi:hypothetical protein